MTGELDVKGHPRLSTVLRGPHWYHAVTAVIDTGFTGAVGVTSELATRPGLLRKGVKTLEGPDGRIRSAACYQVEIDWATGPVRVEATEVAVQETLLGAGILAGHVLVIDYGTARSVEVKPAPALEELDG